MSKTGNRRLRNCRQNRYDLILMDIQMPIMDGHEATGAIRREWERMKLKAQSSKEPSQNLQLSSVSAPSIQHPYRIPASSTIIALTGSAGSGGFDESLYPGMNDCIGKPLQREFLLSVVQKWISTESKTHLNENPADAPPVMDKRPDNNQFPLDLERAVQEFMGRKEILLGVLQKFLETAAFRFDTIRQAVKGADYRVIGSEAHAIKGAAANLTADKLARLASGLEQAAGKQQPDLTGELAGKLEREFDILKKYIQQLPEV